MRKIVHLIPGLYLGGSEKVLELIAEHQCKTGCSSQIITFEISGYESYFSGLKIIHCSVQYEDSLLSDSGIKIEHYESKIDQIKPDVIHSHSYWTDLISHRNLRKEILYISHFHLCYPNYDNLIFKNFGRKNFAKWLDKQRLLKKYQKSNCRFIASSYFIAQFYNSRLPSHLKEKMKVLRNPVDDRYFEMVHTVPVYNLITVGRLEEIKNHEFLIFLVHKLKVLYPNIRVAIVGDGSKKDELQSLAQELKVSQNVMFLGVIKDLREVFAISEIYIHTSHAETFGISIFEAMAAQLPTIVREFDGIDTSTLMNEVNSIVVKGNDHNEFIKAYVKLVDDPAFKGEIIRNGSSTAKQFSATNYLREMDNYYMQK